MTKRTPDGDRRNRPRPAPAGSAARVAAALAVLVGGAILALASQFVLDGWASISLLGDWIQHGLIFWGGVGVGASLTVFHHLAHRKD